MLLQRLLVIVAMFVGFASQAHADERADARAHYMAGVKAYNGADYRAAIKEFQQAQALAPADLNNYNLALCFDKLGEADQAMQYYKVYLDRVPATDKRAEIEASVARLDAAVKSAAAKKAAEAQAIEDAKAAEAQHRHEAMVKAEAEAHAAEEARKAELQRKADEETAKQHPAETVTPAGGSTGTVSSGVAVTTGDRQLDRAQAIDINAIRDQRMGGATSGIPDTHAGPGGAGTMGAIGAAAQGPQNPPPNQSQSPQVGFNGQVSPTGAAAQPPLANGTQPVDQPKHADPLYKKWWFWAIVAVSAYVVYEIATESPNNQATGREAPLHGVTPASRPSGLTLLSW